MSSSFPGRSTADRRTSLRPHHRRCRDMAKDLAFTINPRTLKLDVATKGGSPYYDNTSTHKVLSRLAAHRGRWWADRTGTRGSRLGEVKTLRGVTPTDFEAYAREAL